MKQIQNTPAEIAKALMEQNFPIEKYESIQARRIERLATWKKIGVPVIMANEKKLIKFGEEVLAIMRTNKLS